MSSMRSPLPMAPTRAFGWLMEWMNAPTYRLALKLIQPSRGQSILEIGFGTGRLLEILARSAPDLFLAGVEPTQAMLDMAGGRRSLRRLGERLDLRSGSAEDLPWEDGRFDVVAALHTFQFWSDPELAINEIVRVLRPDGRLVLILRDHSARAPDWLPNPISRSGAEVEGAMDLLLSQGFGAADRAGSAGSSQAILGLLQASTPTDRN